MQTSDPNNFFRTESDLALEDARKLKSERTKNLGSPIDVPGKPLELIISDDHVWCAESGFVARKLDLESGKLLQVFKGHTGPVTTLQLFPSPQSNNPMLITGSWDKTIKIWDTKNKNILSSTVAHSDFVKTLLAVPAMKMLISASADKTVRFWNVRGELTSGDLQSLGFNSTHTRPVQCLAIDIHSESSATLFTADSMGVVKIWGLHREYGDRPSVQLGQLGELNGHRTSINDMWYDKDGGVLWTASTDETVMMEYYPPRPTSRPLPPIPHPKAVKAILPLPLTEFPEPYLITAAGELIRLYDISSPEEPELLFEVDAHWHDVTCLRLWMRNVANSDGKEPWIVSASLDGTIRKWRLRDLVERRSAVELPQPIAKAINPSPALTEEEERELAELMSDDDK
ncbi:WD40 repeat-like protein [Rickenella mellea]|uniref:WD40 repeat-like protein n=1 Tax=Rickenella mellea TaxID=50990 RepID=A0A4Y7QIT9_9AGAM|nr:WD40 repeat-like protein [Rickenella mellea]